MARRRTHQPPARGPRSLADDLRLADDARLTALLTARPELLHPVPKDLADLAVRAAGRGAGAALDRLDALAVQTAEVIASLPEPVSVHDVREAFDRCRPDGVDPAALAEGVDAALGRLRDRALVWGGDDAVHLVLAAQDALGPIPCGLLTERIQGELLSDATLIRRTTAHPTAPPTASGEAVLDEVAEADADVREVLDILAWETPFGRLAGAMRPVTPDTARNPVEWLLARGILLPVAPDTVLLPREISLALRGGRLLQEVAFPARQPQAARTHPVDRVDGSAGQHALATVVAVGDLLEGWSVRPAPVLRSGGLGVRELTATARRLDLDAPTAALVVETALAAGLLARDHQSPESWVPTSAYDDWLDLEPGARWAVLARAWLTTPRAPGMVGQSLPRGGRCNALGQEVQRPAVVGVRRRVLEVLADLPPGAVADPDDLLEVLTDRQPRLAAEERDDLAEQVLREAASLGVTGMGALSTAGRILLTGADDPVTAGRTRARAPVRRDRPWSPPPAALVEAVSGYLPEPVDHVLLQADLTAVAPGPLASDLARELRLAADVESTGGATVFRFGPDSIRRALDAGRDGASLLALLESRSRTPVPQPLRYLVTDVARRHGAVRVGSASAYVRCDDETTLTAVLADRRAAGLGLFRLAPTVLAASAPPEVLLGTLRELGLAPAAESPDGAVVVRSEQARRVPWQARHPVPGTDPGEPAPALVAAAVRALRVGDRAATLPRQSPTRAGVGPQLPMDDEPFEEVPLGPTALTGMLREAIAQERAVVVAYTSMNGTVTRMLVDPLQLRGGFLTAFDHRSQAVCSLAVARMLSVHDADVD